MNILFICGSLEPGKDGVGDYTMRLGAQIAAHGHSVRLVALQDAYVSTSVSETIVDEKYCIVVSRIAASFNDSKRYLLLQKWCSEFNPAWISLQYVPYSFHSLGTPLFLGKKLKKIYQDANWHVMVHEPFLSKQNLTLKKAFIRQLQLFSLKQINHYLQPIWHTSTRQYQQRITQELKMRCQLLGLFGNIPIIEPMHYTSATAEKLTKAIYFGTVPPESQHAIFIEKMKTQIPLTFSQLHFSFCGKGGNEEQEFVNKVKGVLTSISPQFTVSVLGILRADELSALFNEASFGIARVPPALIGKSGSAIAMLEHGLPLWIPMANDQDDVEKEIDFRAELCFADLPAIKPALLTKHDTINRLPLIADLLLANFVESNKLGSEEFFVDTV